MSEVTPASSQNRISNFIHTTAAGVDLAPVNIKPSQILWRIELTFYCSMVCAATIALFPFFLAAFYWPIVWLTFLLSIIFVVRGRWHAKNATPVIVSVQKQIWRLRNVNGEFTVVPYSEILLWSGVIILPLQETLNGKKHYVVALPDSMKVDDWRRLGVWLRTGLRNNL